MTVIKSNSPAFGFRFDRGFIAKTQFGFVRHAG